MSKRKFTPRVSRSYKRDFSVGRVPREILVEEIGFQQNSPGRILRRKILRAAEVIVVAAATVFLVTFLFELGNY
jgi:hypothetical protein